MEVRVERLDHLGVVAGTIKELGIVDMINTRVGTSKQEIVSTGEAVAAMILNNLGFANAPLYLSPNFFSDKALDNLFGREDIEAKNFNPTKLSNSLDAVHAYGLERLFMEIAVSACKIENINVQAKSLE
jgi:transposase